MSVLFLQLIESLSDEIELINGAVVAKKLTIPTANGHIMATWGIHLESSSSCRRLMYLVMVTLRIVRVSFRKTHARLDQLSLSNRCNF